MNASKASRTWYAGASTYGAWAVGLWVSLWGGVNVWCARGLSSAGPAFPPSGFESTRLVGDHWAMRRRRNWWHDLDQVDFGWRMAMSDRSGLESEFVHISGICFRDIVIGKIRGASSPDRVQVEASGVPLRTWSVLVSCSPGVAPRRIAAEILWGPVIASIAVSVAAGFATGVAGYGVRTRWLARRRRAIGLCPVCAYEQTSLPERVARCPECGHDILPLGKADAT